MLKNGEFVAGEKVQLTDRKGQMLTFQLVSDGVTDTSRGQIFHNDIIGQTEGRIIVSHGKTQADSKQSIIPRQLGRKVGGWEYIVMRPRLADYILSMPRGAQIMYPKDIATVLELGDIRRGMRVLESGGGSGAMSLHLLEAIGEDGELTTIEMRPDFARVCEANVTIFYGEKPSWWTIDIGDFDTQILHYDNASFDRIVLDMLDPWNRIEQAHRVIKPGGVLTCYVTTTTQMSRLVDTLVESGSWTQPVIQESMERSWKADALAVRPEHQMIGHTGFIIVTRAMADGFTALKKRDRPQKDTHTDIDTQPVDIAELELRDTSDKKLRKILRDLDKQVDYLTR